MNKALEIYSQILGIHLSTSFEKQLNINPVKLNEERLRVRAVFTAAIIFLKNNPENKKSEILSATNEWLKNTFAEENLFSSIIDSTNKYLTRLVDDNLCDMIISESNNVPVLYETLLGIEAGNGSNRTKVSTAKNYRNKLGSYYTPAILARSVTQETIDTFFELNYGIKKLSTIIHERIDDELLKQIETISFADYSCGGGIFLTEVVNYFEKLFAKWNIDDEEITAKLRTIVLNFTAIDVDFIALEVAKLNILLKIKQSNIYYELSENFIHANFLLQSDFTFDETTKREVFSSGFIYHEKLGINKAKLKNIDIILGNPPWEKIRFEEKRFYALYSNTISNNHFKSSRNNEIIDTELSNSYLAEFSKQYKLEIEKAKSDLKSNNFFELSNSGELNTYALFTDAAVKLKSTRGVVGLVLKSAIVTSQVNKKLFNHLVKNNEVIAIYDFINRKKIFNIDSRERFCFLLLGNSQSRMFFVSMNLKKVEEIENAINKTKMSYDDLVLLNPITGMLPNFSTKQDAEFLLRISYDFPIFKNVFSNIKFGRIVHLTNHVEYISKKKTDKNVPIYEGKFFNQFDGKYSGFNGVEDELRYGNKSSSVILDESQKGIPDYLPESRFFINREKWLQLSKNYEVGFMLAWRNLTSATNKRTCIATILPFIPASQSVQFLTTNNTDLIYLSGLFNSVVFDFILKKKLSGIDLTQSVIRQIPIPEIRQLEKLLDFNGIKATAKQHISSLVFSLLKNDIRLNSLFTDEEMSVDNNNKFELVRDIDLIFMYLYKLSDSELKLVLSEFSKQYSRKDSVWFKNSLYNLRLNKPKSPTSSHVSHLSPD